ncbi:MAG: SurA N-terminal domain-containing protein, partial [Pseudomonadota bacterium]
MLNKMRESASGIFAKILMGILVLSFVIWGIGDIFRSGSDSFNVATVGSLRISLPEYQKTLRNKKEALRRKLGKAYNGDLVTKLGIETIVLQEMIN